MNYRDFFKELFALILRRIVIIERIENGMVCLDGSIHCDWHRRFCLDCARKSDASCRSEEAFSKNADPISRVVPVLASGPVN